MIKGTVYFFLLLSTSSCVFPLEDQTENPQKSTYSYEHPIPFQPRNYVCYRALGNIQVDGKLDEPAWLKANWTEAFVDIEGVLKPNPPLETKAKMLWDDQYFYVAARLEEPHIWATLTERDAVIFQDDDFEVFIDPDGDGQNYYEFEINAFNTVWDLLLLRPYRVDRQPKVLNNWQIKGLKSAVYLSGSLNDNTDTDQFWSVEMAFPWEVLKELSVVSSPPKSGDQWRVNYSRVDWSMENKGKTYQKKMAKNGKPLPEANWVWSPQGRINMHHPETWGYVQFSDIDVGMGVEVFEAKTQESIKWGLWQLYFQQVAYLQAHGTYSADLDLFTKPDIDIPGYRFEVKLHSYPHGFQFSVPDETGQKHWCMNELGKVWNAPTASNMK